MQSQVFTATDLPGERTALNGSHETFELNSVPIADTFAEAFPITGARLIVTAEELRWAQTAATVFCGNATSVIACDVEAAIERLLPPEETPDGRPGVSILAFAFSREALGTAVASRVGQCILTCPTTACYNGLLDCPKEKQIVVGGQLRFFGDGFQSSKKLLGRRLWRIPVMDGEFTCEDRFGAVKGVAGGNLIVCGKSQSAALRAAERAVAAMREVPGAIMPFPGGVVRSGSKVGSRYKKLKASTNDAYCPSLITLTTSALPAGTAAVYEIVIDGLSADCVRDAMRAGLHTASMSDALTLITAGNYGGKLGPHQFRLRDLA
ncbi:MAG TPA: formylmethanofuran--tetrahydromethanopterin N-formyltransferase [Planctomycetaceae bacterium]|jgi:formylmethanofuran--tetrahydromethanopterin N-formyltransferase|nr:formylmethanofuran--tetrahydromethanopterin N-formyltransferase [Planctomycetaceae bacterium]